MRNDTRNCLDQVLGIRPYRRLRELRTAGSDRDPHGSTRYLAVVQETERQSIAAKRTTRMMPSIQPPVDHSRLGARQFKIDLISHS